MPDFSIIAKLPVDMKGSSTKICTPIECSEN